MPFEVHPHMLRHSTGYALANKGTDTRTLQAYLGHRRIQSTVRYTELPPNRFKNLWRRNRPDPCVILSVLTGALSLWGPFLLPVFPVPSAFFILWKTFEDRWP
jgi:hypothetical protein